MSSEFTKHFGKHTNFFLGCIMGGWNSKLPMAMLQDKTSITPFKFLPKTKGFLGFVPLGFLLPSKLSLRDDRWSSSRLWWVSEMVSTFPIRTVEWSNLAFKKKQFEGLGFCLISWFTTGFGFIDFSTTNPTETSVDPSPSRPSLGIPSSGSSKLRGV